MHFHPFGRGMLPVSSNLPLPQRSEGLEGLPKSKGVPVGARVLARQITLSFCSVSILFFYCFVCAFPNQSWQAGWLQTLSPPGCIGSGIDLLGCTGSVKRVSARAPDDPLYRWWMFWARCFTVIQQFRFRDLQTKCTVSTQKGCASLWWSGVARTMPLWAA